jgi:hypothetical protein
MAALLVLRLLLVVLIDVQGALDVRSHVVDRDVAMVFDKTPSFFEPNSRRQQQFVGFALVQPALHVGRNPIAVSNNCRLP